MDGKLSYLLLDSGFLPVLGNTEKVNGKQKIVMPGKAYTIGHNKGVTVIYDERGWPWIYSGTLTNQFCKALDVFKGQVLGHVLSIKNVWVPFSNDGGHFVHDIMPNVLKGGVE